MDDPAGSLWLPLLFWIIFTFFCAVFEMGETASISVGVPGMERRARQGDKRFARIEHMIRNPGRFLLTVRACSIFSSMACGALVADACVSLLIRFGIAPDTHDIMRVLTVVLLTVPTSFITMLFGYLIPKRVSARDPEKVLMRVFIPLKIGCALFFPFVWLLSTMSSAIMLLLGIAPDSRTAEATEREILRLIDKGNEDGHIEKSEKEMINNIFAFDDRNVSEVMTHRTEVVAVSQESTLDEIVHTAMDSGCSRLPVYCESIDNIVGILYVKDLLWLLSRPVRYFDARVYMRKVLFVPDSLDCVQLFSMFKSRRVQIAVAVDEYGGTAGIVSMEDLLESIVGNIQDEYDNEEENVIQLGDDCYSIDGTLPVGDVERLFEIMLDDVSDEHHDTIGGLLTDAFGGLPEPGESAVIVLDGVEFTVLSVAQRRITRIQAKRKQENESGADSEQAASKQGGEGAQ